MVLVIGASVFSAPQLIFGASGTLTLAERDQLTQQLNQLEQQSQAIGQQIQQAAQQARSLKNELSILDNQIKQAQIEIRRLDLVIRQADADISAKVVSIERTSLKIGDAEKQLAASLREISQLDNGNLLEIFLKNKNLSDFFTALNSHEKLQAAIKGSLDNLKDYRTSLENEKAELQDFREGQQEAKSIQEINKRNLSEKRKERDDLLKQTQGKESLYQQLLRKNNSAIAAIKNKLYYLEEIGITPEEALAAAKLASRRTNIRTAFLLALLEVETGRQFEDGQLTVGSNLGRGNWKTDMYDCYVNLGRVSTAETQKAAFFQITGELGLDPDKMPVSRKPNYGCGGAMGPAQFIPTTWLKFSDRVASLTGKGVASPWNTEDAFTAAALFLGDAGATSQTKAGEFAAAHIYISGRANCPSTGSARVACISYANRIYSLSQDIERALET